MITTSLQRLTAKLDNKLQVLAVGDCNTYGIAEPPNSNTILDKFCRCLEQAGYPTSSQNLGFGMATSREGIALVEQKAKRADILLLNFGLVDSWVTSVPKIYIPYFPENRGKKILRKLLKFFKRRLRAPLLRLVIPSGHVVPLVEFRRNMEMIIQRVRSLNPEVQVMLWGCPPVQNDPKRNQDLLRYNAELHDLANCAQANYIPTKPIIDHLSTEEAFLDKVHLNEAATSAIAAEMAHCWLSQLQRTAA